jgi:hypothetical protein
VTQLNVTAEAYELWSSSSAVGEVHLKGSCMLQRAQRVSGQMAHRSEPAAVRLGTHNSATRTWTMRSSSASEWARYRLGRKAQLFQLCRHVHTGSQCRPYIFCAHRLCSPFPEWPMRETGNSLSDEVNPVLNYSNTKPWRCTGEWRYSSIIFDLGLRWTWLVNFRSSRFTKSKNKNKLWRMASSGMLRRVALVWTDV